MDKKEKEAFLGKLDIKGKVPKSHYLLTIEISVQILQNSKKLDVLTKWEFLAKMTKLDPGSP